MVNIIQTGSIYDSVTGAVLMIALSLVELRVLGI
jgi:hypothetical protein